MPERGGDRAVDAGEAAVGVHRDPLARDDHVDLADEPGCPEHEPIVRPGRPPHRFDECAPGDGCAHRVEFGAHVGSELRGDVRGGLGRFDEGTGGRDPRPGPGSRGRFAGDEHSIRESGHPSAGVVVVGVATAHDDRLDAVALDELGHLPAEGGVAEHDHALDRVAEPGIAQQFAVGDDEVGAEVRPAGHLGDEGRAELPGDLLGALPGTATGDDDRADRGHELAHLVRLAARALVAALLALLADSVERPDTPAGDRRDRRVGTLNRIREGRNEVVEGQWGRERLREGEVEVHGAGCRDEGLAREPGRGIPLSLLARGRPDIPAAPHRGAEDARLLGGLVGADAAQRLRPVGGDHDQRNTGVVRLEHRRMQVRDSGPRRRDDEHGTSALDREPEGEETADALVDAHAQPDQPEPLELRRREREGLRPGPGREHDLAHAQTNELLQQGDGEISRRGVSRRPASHRRDRRVPARGGGCAPGGRRAR